ncbi:MAG: ComF family protein [Caldilineaceae bacterium]|nr:ComF family protein [Caldilineaceae bacterium]
MTSNRPAWLAALFRYGADLIFPPTCAGCGRAGALLCADCAQAVDPTPSTVCSHCGRLQFVAVPLCSLCARESDPPLMWTRAAALHTHPLREAIHRFKYRKQPELAEPLSRYLVANFQQPPWIDLPHSLDACVPTPLHPKRLLERGYNQAGLLAKAFAEKVNLAVEESWLARSRETASQATLSAEQRRHNIAGAFTAPPAVKGKHILVIDDVTTTGATLTACAYALRDAGATAVYGLALATPRLPGSKDPHQMAG